MAKNELLPFANGEDANVLPTNQWEALTDILENGFQSGIARSEQVNRVLAQGAVASYVLGQLIVDQLNKDATLDKDSLYQNLILALQENAKDACLPLSGGKMTGSLSGENGYTFTWGDIRIINDYIAKLNSSGSNNLCSNTGYDNGPSVSVYGPDFPSEYFKNKFFIRAGSGTQKELVGSADGDLIWDGKNVERVNSFGTNYIRYENGLQVVWQEVQMSSNGGAFWTFPVPFATGLYGLSAIIQGAFDRNWSVLYTGSSGTGVNIWVKENGTSSANQWVKAMAIGYWK